jgi:hypothetical protein
MDDDHLETMRDAGCDHAYVVATGYMQEAYSALRTRMNPEQATEELATLVLNAPTYELGHELRRAKLENRIC